MALCRDAYFSCTEYYSMPIYRRWLLRSILASGSRWVRMAMCDLSPCWSGMFLRRVTFLN